jgi:acyl-CoA thioesterase-2
MSELVELLDMERIADGVWSAATPSGSERGNLYGGLVAAQALRAGHNSVDPERLPHSVHAYFLSAGRFDETLELRVEATRDGGSFSARRIEAVQAGRTICTMLASFQVPHDGDDYHVAGASLPPPAPTAVTMPTGYETGTGGDGPFELVDLEPGEMRDGSLDWSAARYWCRSRDPLPDDPVVHACGLVAMGDLRTGDAPLAAKSADGEVFMTSLDYSTWFHRPTRADAWSLFDLRPGGNGGARGLALGLVHGVDGAQSASFTMELLMRPRD